MFTEEEARELLTRADLFFGKDDDDGVEGKDWAQTLNMNDTWAWACADGQYVPDEELPLLAELFWRYGHCGVLYWVSQRRGRVRSEFKDINRHIEFVTEEERIRQEEPDSSKRAYLQRSYVIGAVTR